DFAAYITQAISLLRGTENESIAHAAFAARQSSRYYGPIAAPWGFPAILAPVYRACGGLNIRCLKLVNIPFFAAFLTAFFFILIRRLSFLDSTIVLSVMAFSPVLLAFHDNVLSDLSFLFLSTFSVLLIDLGIVVREKPEGSLAGNLAIGIVLFLAFFVRPNGALLLPTLLLTQLVLMGRDPLRRGSWKRVVRSAWVPYAAFAVLAAALAAPLPGGGVADATHFRTLTVRGLMDNVAANVILPSVFFWPLPLYDLWYGALLPFLISGAVLHARREI